MFSPLCKPGSTMAGYGDDKQIAEMNLARENYDKGRQCYIKPVEERRAVVKQYTDTTESAGEWSKDPSYSDLVNMRDRCTVLNDTVCKKFFNDTTDSFKKYRQLKLAERVAASMMNTL